MSKLSLSRAVSLYVKGSQEGERAFTLTAAPVLAQLHTKYGEEVSELRAAWKKLTVAAYRDNGLRPRTPEYRRQASLFSMLLQVSFKKPSAFAALVAGKYTPLSKLYRQPRNSQKAAPKTFRARVVAMLTRATPAQRAYLRKNLVRLLKLTEAK